MLLFLKPTDEKQFHDGSGCITPFSGEYICDTNLGSTCGRVTRGERANALAADRVLVSTSA
ncbi:MAG: hypothetical protein ACE5F6_04400, partial [Anaerolineae bacterium]